MALNQLTIRQAHQGLKNREFSATELTTAVLEQIKKMDKQIHAYLTLTEALALEQAKKVDEKIKKREQIGILEGIPIAIKDNILVEGIKCTAGSKILENYIAPYQATVVKKLKKAGAVILGKTNMDEFAMGSSTEHSAFGPTKNPIDLERVPGGSSGGSAAAVAADECLAALGSDTGGSIRQPACFCGVAGLKPTYGRVSRYGLIAMASSLDQIGPLTKTVEDAEVILKVIEGKDEMDSTSIDLGERLEREKKDSLSVSNLKSVKIGLPKEYFTQGLDPEVEEVIKQAITKFEKLGGQIEEISLPHTDYSLAAYYIIMPSEISANLARYDGLKYGLSEKAQSLLGVYLKTRQDGFGSEVKRRIMIGTYALSAGYYEAYYLKAQKVRALVKQDFDQAFEKVDLIMTPVSPFPAFKLGEKIDDPIKMYLSDVYTVPINLAGLPSLSMPVGQVGRLPVGLQIIGPHFKEELILEIGKRFEQGGEQRASKEASKEA